MNLVWAVLIVLGVAALAIAAMLLVRRGAPEGSYFEDGDRASGVFGVLATGFAVLIGFVLVFLDHPYQSGVGGLRPVAMERALGQIGEERAFARERTSSRATRMGPREWPEVRDA